MDAWPGDRCKSHGLNTCGLNARRHCFSTNSSSSLSSSLVESINRKRKKLSLIELCGNREIMIKNTLLKKVIKVNRKKKKYRKCCVFIWSSFNDRKLAICLTVGHKIQPDSNEEVCISFIEIYLCLLLRYENNTIIYYYIIYFHTIKK